MRVVELRHGLGVHEAQRVGVEAGKAGVLLLEGAYGRWDHQRFWLELLAAVVDAVAGASG